MAMTEFGYAIHRGAVLKKDVDAALRLIWMQLFNEGFDPDIDVDKPRTCWFPYLRNDPEIKALLPQKLVRGEVCEPQILVQPPDKEDGPIEFHTDVEPPWAAGRKYKQIIGVALTWQRRSNGGLIVKPKDSKYGISIMLEPGDVIEMEPDLLHSSGYNLSAMPRIAVYFRTLH